MSLRPSLSMIAVLAAIGFHPSQVLANKDSGAIVVAEDGTIEVPAFSIPLSQYMSEEAKAEFLDARRRGGRIPPIDKDSPDSVLKARSAYDDLIRPKLARAKQRYPVKIESRDIGGVRAHVIEPEADIPRENKARVLMNLHGGGFVMGDGLGIAESIPIASIGRVKVIAVDYRMAPEHKFPAASEDVAAVYKELLKEHAAAEIGIFGCSAGGVLAAMSVSWFQQHDLPAPGAIAMMSAAAFGNFNSPAPRGSWSGDSAYVARPLNGGEPWSLDNDHLLPSYSYLSEANLSDPLVSPALWPKVLAKFPPSLLVTGTRASDMSAAVQTHRELVKAGVAADLHLWDGMGHCFFLEPDLPESREAYDVVVDFFNKHLAMSRH